MWQGSYLRDSVAPREEFELVETRRISGRGLIKYTPAEADRHFWLYASIIRFPKVDFGSSKFNPDKSDYAKLTWFRDGYIIRENAVSFEKQAYQFAVDPTGYISSAVVCMFEQLRSDIYEMYPPLALTVPPEDPINRIYFEPLVDSFDEIRIVCREATAIEFKLYRLKYDVACPEAEPTPKKPPPPPPPPPPVQPETPIPDISPPYDDETDDDNTLPYPLDEPPEPPPPEPDDGEPRVVSIVIKYRTLFGGATETHTAEVRTPYKVQHDAYFGSLRIRAANFTVPPWDGVSYVNHPFTTTYNHFGDPIFDILSIDDPTGYVPIVDTFDPNA